MVIPLRGQSWSTAWLPRERIGTRLALGVLVACLAVTTYSLFRRGADPAWVLLARIWRPSNLAQMTQVVLEDLTIALLFVRFAAAAGRGTAIATIACLFAAGHIPALLAQGASWSAIGALALDAGLGVVIVATLQRSGDVLWFWCLHFSLDMTQFGRTSGVG